MDLAETNEALLKENKYITQKSYVFLDIDELKKTLNKQGLTVRDDLLKRAILDTSGETKSIMLYLLHHVPDEMKVEVILKNRTLLKEIEVTPYVVSNLIHRDKTFIHDFSVDVLAKARKQYVFEITNPFLIHEIIKSDPTILDVVPWKQYVNKKLLLELGFHTDFTEEEMLEDIKNLTGPVGVVAICHAKGIKIGKSRCSMTRFMSGPWTTCSVNGYRYTIPIFHQIVSKKNILDGEVYPSSTSRSEIEEQLQRKPPSDRVKVEHRLKLTEDMNAPWMNTFEIGDPLLLKRFSDGTSTQYDGFKFLLIKGQTKTFNLFSLKHVWTMEEIIDLLKWTGKHVVFLDYSCNGLDPSLSIPPEQLSKLGGRKTRRSRVS